VIRGTHVIGTRRPAIGITPDVRRAPADSSQQVYELKIDYADAVLRAGGLPLILPYCTESSGLDAYLSRISGLLVTGGAFDIAPDTYGEPTREGMGPVKPDRTRFEYDLMRAALDRNLPVLGICGGMQLLNVVLGGTLFQDIRAELPHANEHEQKHDRHQPHHPVDVKDGTLLSSLLGKGQVMVNSSHHQAAKTVGERAIVSALAPDGVIEALEVPSHSFAVGVQWHPELLISSIPVHLALYRALVQKAREVRR
jgi:putative glutamine amidotransferase